MRQTRGNVGKQSASRVCDGARVHVHWLEETSHWPMIEAPEYIGDAIIARLDSV
jgi:pimeloyl-ACP methyl ester carboxylesterase